jgi:AraC-like DNA-binding protein
MGTYPQGIQQSTRKKTRRIRHNPTQATVDNVLETLILNPKLSLLTVSTANGMGSSTTSNWFKAYTTKTSKGGLAVSNSKVLDWLARDTDGVSNLARIAKARPNLTISPEVRDTVSEMLGDAPAPAPDVVPVGESSDAFTAAFKAERLVGPVGIGTFVPGTTDDLLVVKEEALRIKAEAEAVALEATVLATAIDTVKDWLTDKDRLQQALGRIQNLESQLRESDTILKRFQQQKLASNQVHSSD